MYFYRYQYYLQLKADVIDGKLNCTLEQAILLAGYALQGKYNLLVDTARYVQAISTYCKVSTIYEYIQQDKYNPLVHTTR